MYKRLKDVCCSKAEGCSSHSLTIAVKSVKAIQLYTLMVCLFLVSLEKVENELAIISKL